MQDHNKSFQDCMAEAFYGSASVGDRGQIVIPVEARNDLGLQPGDKVLIMRHPIHRGLQIFKIDAVKQFIDEFAATVERMEQHVSEEED